MGGRWALKHWWIVVHLFFSIIVYCTAFIFLYFECHCFQSYKQVKRIYVPLPDPNVRRLLLKNQLKGHAFKLSSKCSRVLIGSYSLCLYKLKPNLEMVPDRLWFWKTCCGDWRYFIFWYMVILKRWPMWSFCAETVLFLGYSGSDLRALCEEAAMMPIRELGPQNILTIKANQVHFLKQSEHRYISFGFYSWLHNSWNKLLVISLRIRMGMSTCKAS